MEKVKGQKYLYQRGGIYYFRVVIPKKYRDYFQKSEIRESLNTSNMRHAISKVCENILSYHKNLEDYDQQILKAKKSTPLPLRQNISKFELENIVRDWFYKKKEQIDIRERANQSDFDTILSEESFKVGLQKEAVGRMGNRTLFAHWTVDDLLKENNISKDIPSHQLQYLSDLVNRALLELSRQNVDSLNGDLNTSYDTLFSIQKSNQIKRVASLLISKIVEEYENDPSHKWAEKTRITYKHQHRLIIDFFSSEKLVGLSERDKCIAFRNMIQEYPKNATKKYPTLKFHEAIKKAKKENAPLLSISSQNDYLTKLSSIMEWAVINDMIDKNPAKKLFISDPEPNKSKRNSFSIEQLQKIFKMPLFTGSQDDERGYNTPGPFVIKRSRYWLPLLGLFTGARLNELAQLNTDDIKILDGITVISINNDHDDKRLKTLNSERSVPIHSELIKMGFLDYVKYIKSIESTKLFPELTNHQNGSYSYLPSKRFATLLKASGAKTSKTNFHSFRHTFKDALESNDVAEAIIDQICGWASKGTSGGYGSGVNLKKFDKIIQQVKFDKLDLSHLYKSS